MARKRKRSVVGFGNNNERFIANNRFEAMGAKQSNSGNRTKRNTGRFQVGAGIFQSAAGSVVAGLGGFFIGGINIVAGVSNTKLGFDKIDKAHVGQKKNFGMLRDRQGIKLGDARKVKPKKAKSTKRTTKRKPKLRARRRADGKGYTTRKFRTR